MTPNTPGNEHEIAVPRADNAGPGQNDDTRVTGIILRRHDKTSVDRRDECDDATGLPNPGHSSL
jgi:hypothetical protein